MPGMDFIIELMAAACPRDDFHDADSCCRRASDRPHQNAPHSPSANSLRDQALEQSLLVTVEVIDNREVIRRTARPFRAGRVDKTVLPALTVAAADFLAQLDQLSLALALCPSGKNTSYPLERVKRPAW